MTHHESLTLQLVPIKPKVRVKTQIKPCNLYDLVKTIEKDFFDSTDDRTYDDFINFLKFLKDEAERI